MNAQGNIRNAFLASEDEPEIRRGKLFTFETFSVQAVQSEDFLEVLNAQRLADVLPDDVETTSSAEHEAAHYYPSPPTVDALKGRFLKLLGKYRFRIQNLETYKIQRPFVHDYFVCAVLLFSLVI